MKNHNIWTCWKIWCIMTNFRFCDFSKIVKKQQKFLATLWSYFWAQMGQKCRVVGKNSMCGHPVQFAQHLNVANFRRFFMIFGNFWNISIFQRELWGARNFLRPSQDIPELKYVKSAWFYTKSSICGHRVQFALHLSNGYFFPFFIIFENKSLS